MDRTDAGQALARSLEHLRGTDLVVLGLPRGGVPVAFEVAKALGAPLDVIVVRKLGVPYQPELAMGAIGEGGIKVSNDDVIRRGGITPQEIAAVEQRERADLVQQAQRFRLGRPNVDVAGRTAVIVDDGIATGSTAAAACQVARQMSATRVILAVPVGAPESIRSLELVYDEVDCLYAPEHFMAVGTFYDNFRHVPDTEVTDLLARSLETVRVTAGQQDSPSEPSQAGSITTDAARTPGPQERDEEVRLRVSGESVVLDGHLTIPANPTGTVIFVHGSGSSRHSPRNRFVASQLNEAGLGTLLFDLLTKEEEVERANVFDIQALAARLADVTKWVRDQPGGLHSALGYFGASTGAAAALWAAAEPGAHIDAVVSRGGRPDLAETRLADVNSPTLLIVGSRDEVVLGLNKQAQEQLRSPNRLAIVPGATHLFEEPGALRTVTRLAREWFTAYFARPI
ncbi:MAG TPA: phosphoribosyltransferase family protein [Streptosporangiaceae bacterium]|jgi:putative phosphoribosyl transferase|nr:phosphoribosyltransferase family protein [Streptosporangiaceae bacterium]